jgi:hypothetical protein
MRSGSPLPFQPGVQPRDLVFGHAGHVTSYPHVHLVQDVNQLLAVYTQIFGNFIDADCRQRLSSLMSRP